MEQSPFLTTCVPYLIQTLTEQQGSLSCAHELASGLCPEPDESNPQLHTVFI